MKTIRQMLLDKRDSLCQISPDASVLEALQIMEQNRAEALLVTENDTLVGMLTQANVARKVALLGRPAGNTRVADVMERQLHPVDASETCEECINLMTRTHSYHLPVVSGRRVLGIISMEDVVSDLVDHQQGTIRFLEDLMLDTETA